MDNFIKKLLYCVFGEWNGIQNLLVFPVLVFLFEKASFTKWIIGMVSLHRYYLPVFFYVLILLFFMFIVVKAVAQWIHNSPANSALPKTKLGRDLLLPLSINLNSGLLLLLMSLMLVFMLKSGFTYIYRTNLPFFTAFLLMVRIGMIFCLIYSYTFLDVVIPVIRRGHGYDLARRYFYILIGLRWKRFIMILVAQILMIYASVAVFEKLIGFVEELNSWGIITLSGKPLLIHFQEGKTVSQVALNTLILAGGFMISNLIYCPFMLLFKKGFQIFKLKLNG